MITGTAEHKKQSSHSCILLEPCSVPSGVTNTGITVCDPGRLVSVAAYVPVLAEVAAMVRVKLKEVVPAGELEHGLLRV